MWGFRLTVLLLLPMFFLPVWRCMQYLLRRNKEFRPMCSGGRVMKPRLFKTLRLTWNIVPARQQSIPALQSQSKGNPMADAHLADVLETWFCSFSTFCSKEVPNPVRWGVYHFFPRSVAANWGSCLCQAKLIMLCLEEAGNLLLCGVTVLLNTRDLASLLLCDAGFLVRSVKDWAFWVE